jgi:hypothetical protein
MKYAILKTDDGHHYGKVFDGEGNVLFETKVYKTAGTVRQHLRRWIRQQQLSSGTPEEE